MEICPGCFGTAVMCRVCMGTGFTGPTDRPPLFLRPKRADLRGFAGSGSPLRASGLDSLCRCPWRSAVGYLFEHEGESGPAADTGSAVHAAVAAWHREGKDAAAAIRSMVMRCGEFPSADLDEAAALFLLYSRDPRNIAADIVLLEEQVSFALPPSPEDPTGELIFVQGRVDQVRRTPAGLRVFDIKTSKRLGRTLLDEHMRQVAAYCIGSSLRLGERVGPGALVLVRGYCGKLPDASPDGVFFEFPWTFEDCRHVLWGVRQVVAALRRGEAWNVGGDYCRWCACGGTDACVPLLRASTDPGTMRISLQVLSAELPGVLPTVQLDGIF